MPVLSPVFGREMATLARRRRHYFSRALLLGTALLMTWTLWRTFARQAYWYGFADSSEMGRMLFAVFAYSQFVAVLVLMPVLTAPVIASEKERDTLGLLLMTNLRVHNILLDKLLSRMVLLALLLLSCLPLLLLLPALGGVTAAQVAVVYVDIAGAMLMCGALGLLFSTALNATHTAIIGTGMTVSLLCLAWYSIGGRLWNIRSLGGGLRATGCMGMTMPYSLLFLLTAATLFLVSLGVCARTLPRIAEMRRRHWIKNLFARMNVFFHRINFTGIILMSDRRPVGDAPLLWRDTRQHFFGSDLFAFRLSYALIAVFMVTFMLLPSWESFHGMVAAGAFLGLGVMAIVLSASAFSREREQHSLDLLLASPLKARAFIMAKFLRVLKLLLPLCLSIGLWVAIESFVDWSSDFSLMKTYAVILAAFLPAVVVIGLWCSAARRRTGTAILQTFLVCAVWWLVPYAVLIWQSSSMRFTSSNYFWVREVQALTPIGMLGFYRWSSAEWLSLLLVPVWIVLLFALIRRFDRLTGRR